MKKKFKLFSTIASLCLAVCLMAFGVYAATQATYGIKGKVTFTASANVYVQLTDIEVYTANNYIEGATVADFAKTYDSGAASPEGYNWTKVADHAYAYSLASDSRDTSRDYATYKLADTSPLVNANKDDTASMAFAFQNTTSDTENNAIYAYKVVFKFRAEKAHTKFTAIPTAFARTDGKAFDAEGEEVALISSATTTHDATKEDLGTTADFGDIEIVFYVALTDISTSIGGTEGLDLSANIVFNNSNTSGQ